MEKKNSFMQTNLFFLFCFLCLYLWCCPCLFNRFITSLTVIYVFQTWHRCSDSVSLAYPLQNAILSAAVGIGVGISSAISIHLGAGNREKADRAATLGIALTLIHCIFFIIAGLTISEPFLKLFTDNPKILNDASIYTEIVLCLSFGSLFQIAFEKIFQGIGEMKITMYLSHRRLCRQYYTRSDPDLRIARFPGAWRCRRCHRHRDRTDQRLTLIHHRI